MHKMRIMGPKGDTTVTWETDIAEQVAEAQRQFEEMIQEGYHAFDKGSQEFVQTFDPEVEELIVFGQLAGG